jgi:hypothetical protein
VARQAAVDRDFRALALVDGRAAIARITKKPLPKGLGFKFIDNSGPVKIVPLPDFAPTASGELSEVEMDAVAGGAEPPPPITISGGWSKISRLRR